jgi:PAS domain-containing protein
MKRHSKGGAPTKAPRRKTAMPKRRNAPKAARRRGSSAAGLKAKAAQLTRELRESLQQQKATAEVLRIISLSHGELQPIFQAVLENATRICDAKFGNLLRFDGNALHLAAWLGTPPEFLEFQRRRGPFQPPPGGHLDRAVRTKQVSHSADEAAEAGPSPATMLGGARSIVSVPLLNDDVLIGVIVIYRQEVRPFTDRQIALVQDFAAQAVIAIENARLHADRLKAEESVRKAEGELRTVIDAIPAMAWSATPDGALISSIEAGSNTLTCLWRKRRASVGLKRFIPMIVPPSWIVFKKPSRPARRTRMRVGSDGRTGNIAGSWFAVLRCAMKRETLSNGSERASTSRSGSGPKLNGTKRAWNPRDWHPSLPHPILPLSAKSSMAALHHGTPPRRASSGTLQTR